MFRRHRVQPRSVIAADQEATLRKLVANGTGLSLLREDQALAARDMGEVVLWDKEFAATHLSFIYHRTRGADPLIEAAVGIVRQVWPEASKAVSCP